MYLCYLTHCTDNGAPRSTKTALHSYPYRWPWNIYLFSQQPYHRLKSEEITLKLRTPALISPEILSGNLIQIDSRPHPIFALIGLPQQVEIVCNMMILLFISISARDKCNGSVSSELRVSRVSLLLSVIHPWSDFRRACMYKNTDMLYDLSWQKIYRHDYRPFLTDRLQIK